VQCSAPRLLIKEWFIAAVFCLSYRESAGCHSCEHWQQQQQQHNQQHQLSQVNTS
jgi:hypothetical protein